MGAVRNARTAVEVLTQSPGNVRNARTAVEVITQQRGRVRDARTAVEVLTQQRGKVRDARSAVEVLLATNWAEVLWGVALNIVPPIVKYVEMNFNVANTSTIPAGTFGPAPVENNGDWSVNSNQLLAPGSGEAVISWDTSHTSYTMEFDIVNIAVDPGPCVRLQDAANYILVQMNSGGTSAIYQRVGGGYSALIGAVSVPWANGDHIKVVVNPIKIDVYRNGTLVMTSTTSVFNTMTKVGFRTNGGACRFDNLLVTDQQ